MLFWVRMRFRAKFGALDWCVVGMALFAIVLWLSGAHLGVMTFLAVVPLASLRILSQLFIFWDVDGDFLRERRLWSTHQIPWHEVVYVGSWNPSWLESDYLEIDYARPAPLSERGSVKANPEDRARFIASLHRFAPQADFEV